MTRDELVEALLVERFAPIQSPPSAIHHTRPVAVVVDELAVRRRLRSVGKPGRHTQRDDSGRFTVRRNVG